MLATGLRVARYLAGLAILVSATGAAFFGALRSWCEEQVAQVGSLPVVSTCRPLQASDLPFALLLLLLVALALPDLKAVTFAGVDIQRKIENEGSETRDVMRAVAARIENAVSVNHTATLSAPTYIGQGLSGESVRGRLASLGVALLDDHHELRGEDLYAYTAALLAAEGALRQLDAVRQTYVSGVDGLHTAAEVDALWGVLSSTEMAIAGRPLMAIDAVAALSALGDHEQKLRMFVEQCWNLGQLTTTSGDELDPSLIRAVTKELEDQVASMRSVVARWSHDTPPPRHSPVSDSSVLS